MGLVSEKLLPRIPIIEVFPVIEDGTLPAKATEGEPFPVRATVFREGHDAFAAEAVLLRPDGGEYSRTRMVDIAPGLDRYEAWVAAAAYRESRTGAICTPVKALTLSPDVWATAI